MDTGGTLTLGLGEEPLGSPYFGNHAITYVGPCNKLDALKLKIMESTVVFCISATPASQRLRRSSCPVQYLSRIS